MKSVGRKTCHGDCLCGKSIEERLKHFRPELKRLLNAKPAERVNMLKAADGCLIKVLCEAALNVLKGNVKLEESQYKKLRPHKRLLMYVAKPTISLNKRRQALMQKKGGFVPLLIPPLLSALAGFALNKLLG